MTVSKQLSGQMEISPRRTMPLSFLPFSLVTRYRRHNKYGGGELLFYSYTVTLAILAFASQLSFAEGGSISSGFLSAPDSSRACFCTRNGVVASSLNFSDKFDSTRDYFASTGKVHAEYSALWSVTYHKYFKRIEVSLDRNAQQKVVIYAYLCGAPRLSSNERNILFNDTGNSAIVYSMDVDIPFRNVALYSTTFIPGLEYIGQRHSIIHVNADYSTFSPCIKKRYFEGKLTDVTSGSFDSLATSVSAVSETLDAAFKNSFGWSGSWGIAKDIFLLQNVSNSSISLIPVTDYAEKTYIASAEWVEFYSLFFNREIAAASVLDNIVLRFNCSSRTVASKNLVKPQVLVASGGDWGYYASSCPNWYCHMVESAGGEIIQFATTSNDTQFLSEVASKADVWIYTDANWEVPSEYNTAFSSSRMDLLTPLKAFQNKQIYDITKLSSWEWFESAQAEPDVLLRDFIEALFPGQHLLGNHTRVFLRNVFNESRGNGGVCLDEDKPRFTNWVKTGCGLVTNNSIVVIPGTGGEVDTYNNCSAWVDSVVDPVVSPKSAVFINCSLLSAIICWLIIALSQ